MTGMIEGYFGPEIFDSRILFGVFGGFLKVGNRRRGSFKVFRLSPQHSHTHMYIHSTMFEYHSQE